MKYFLCAFFLFCLLPSMGFGEEKRPHEAQPQLSGVEMLPPDLRHLLVQEMQFIQSGMVSIIPAYMSGNWNDIADTAEKIKNSYILKKSLTEAQLKELHLLLPHEFIEKDQEFHYLAGMLEHVAKNRKSELINFYFSKMNEACVSCHAKFAIHKFPALLTVIGDAHKH